MHRKPFLALGAFALVVFLHTSPAVALDGEAENFVRVMGKKVFASLGEKGISDRERTKRFTVLLPEALDLEYIARFTLGRYWRVATEEQKIEYTRLFKKFVIQAYANRFKGLSGKTFNVLHSRSIAANQVLVLSEIIIPNQPVVRVNWRVRSKENTHKITDIMVEGISMSVTQRDEFVSVIRQTGGKVSGLIRALRKKTSGN
tara:strand:+ start:2337 stop:2942 length:606 start_codon:yes stop_codon:yes gene_type:complete